MSKYIGNIPVPNATQTRTRIVATSGQTTFTTSDSYTPGYIDVFLGGVKLDSSEFTATNGTTVVLATGANTGQIFESISYTTYALDSTVASQTGNSGKYLTTDGTNTSWADVNTSEAATSFKLKSYTTTQRDALTDSEAGDIIFNTTTGVLEVYGGEGWYAPHAMSIDSVTGDITAGFSSTLNFTSTGLSSTVDIRYYEGATLLATTSSVTVTNGAFSDTVPSAVYGQSEGDDITIKIVSNGSELFAATKTVTALAVASGGTETTSGSYQVHTFTSSGTLTVPSGTTISNVEYLVVAGGGGGGDYGGGGGAGGYRCSVVGENSGGGASAESRITLAAGSYTVTIGAGGTGTGGNYTDGNSGTNSSLIGGAISIASTGGGAGQSYKGSGTTQAASGGSGGGAGINESSSFNAGGSGTTGQGYAGASAGTGRQNTGQYPPGNGGGGAGAVGVGGFGKGSTSDAAGGAGVESSIDGTATYRAGGGGGFNPNITSGSWASSGGTGGGGNGALHPSYGGAAGQNGTANTGGGGGSATGNNATNIPGTGGSGVVIIRYIP